MVSFDDDASHRHALGNNMKAVTLLSKEWIVKDRNIRFKSLAGPAKSGVRDDESANIHMILIRKANYKTDNSCLLSLQII